MADRVSLIHPIYLDVPMLVSFAAAVDGGISYGSEVTMQAADEERGSKSVNGSLGLGPLFNNLFNVSMSAGAATEENQMRGETRKEFRSHTEASIAILLYSRLKHEEGLLTTLSDGQSLEGLDPGTLVEVRGTIRKNAVDTMIDYMDAVSILASLGTGDDALKHDDRSTKSDRKRATSKKDPTGLQGMRMALASDRERTPISNALLDCDQPPGLRGVVTLRRSNLRDLTLSELDKNTLRIVGKVTRTVQTGESMSAFENYGLSMIEPEKLKDVFDGVAAVSDIVADFSPVQVDGPAFQILPLMIFV